MKDSHLSRYASPHPQRGAALLLVCFLCFSSSAFADGDPVTETGSTIGSSSESSSFSSESSSSSSSSPHLLISEILSDPAGSDDAEWIELMNDGDDEIDIVGYSLDSGTSTRFTFPAGSFLGSHTVLLVPRSQSHLTLPNAGGTVHLWDPSGLKIDEVSYPALPEQTSFGRSPNDSTHLQRLCVPTAGAPNQVIPLDIAIAVQSGETVGEGKITLNLQAVASNGALSDAVCLFDYGDGFVAQSCNPNSHSITQTGDNEVSLRVTDQCGITVEQTIAYHVLPKPSSSSSESSEPPEEEDSEDDPVPLSTLASFLGLSCPLQGIGSVHLSEIVPDPDGSDDNEWIELWNGSSDTLTLCGWQLDDSEGGSKPFALDTISLNPKEYRVFPRSITGLALNNTNESVRLLAPIGDSSDHQIADVMSYQKSEPKKAYARKADGTFGWTELLTPGTANQFTEDQEPLLGTVTHIVDGDTVDVSLDEPSNILKGKTDVRVRMIGIDTPETVDPHKPVQAYGIQASNFTRALLENKKVELLFDSNVMDTYDRVLAYIQLSDGSLAQEKLLQNGLAFAYLRYPFSKKEAFVSLETEAKAKKINLWSDKEAQVYAEKQATAEMKEDTGGVLSHEDDSGMNQDLSDAILLSEIYPHPMSLKSKSQGSEDLTTEWVELENSSDKEVNIEGWVIDDVSDGGSKPYTFPKGSVIAPHSFKLILKSESKLSLNDIADNVTLFRPDGKAVGALEYEKISAGTSMSFVDGRWCLSSVPTPGQPNRCKGGSALPQAVQSVLPFQNTLQMPFLSGKTAKKAKNKSFLSEKQDGSLDELFGSILEGKEGNDSGLQKGGSSLWFIVPACLVFGLCIGLGVFIWRQRKILTCLTK